MNQKVMIIMNPKAGKGASRTSLFTICNRFSKMEDLVTVFVTQHRHHAKELTITYASSYDLLIVIGGDGTWNEVISGMMEVKHKPLLAYLPQGTVNDFASSLQLPKTADKMMDVMEDPDRFTCDCGKFNDRYFTYIAAFGLFTDVSYSTPQDAKNSLGRIAYFLEGMRQLTKIPRYHIHVKTKDVSFEDDCMFGCITNSHFIAGFPSFCTDHTQLNDGLFEALFIRVPNNPLDVQTIIAALLKREINEDWMYFITCDHLIMTSEEMIPWTLDGENGGCVTKAEISNMREAFTICIRKNEE